MIGLELNDAGIIAAGDNGKLLALDPGGTASPGFAVIKSGELQVGAIAEKCNRQVPRQINHRFWDQLASQPLQDPAFAGWTPADLAHGHLKGIWERLSPSHQDVLVAVPDAYGGPQLELLAGVMNALSIPVRGFVSLALAALPEIRPSKAFLHLELYLHRCVLTVLNARREARVLESTSIDGLGLDRLRSAWLQVIADEFVRHTRFDPFHDADTEQRLYDRLPNLLNTLNGSEDTEIEMHTTAASHRIRLTRGQMEQPLTPLMDAIHRQIYRLQQDHFQQEVPPTIFVGHRAAGLPGFCPRLEAATGARTHSLPEGAGALGVLAYKKAFPRRERGKGVPFLNRQPRAGKRPDTDARDNPQTDTPEPPAATHLVYRSRGYPVTDRPLVIGREIPTGSPGILIRGRTEGVSRHHCRVMRKGNRVVLTDTSTYGTFVNGTKIETEAELSIGQSIRVGTPGEQLQVIACLEENETSID